MWINVHHNTSPFKTNYHFSMYRSHTNYELILHSFRHFDAQQRHAVLYGLRHILREEDPRKVLVRLVLAQNVAKTIKNGMALLGIEVPERM